MSLACSQHERKRERAERRRARAVGDRLRVVDGLQLLRPERSRRIVAGGRLDADHPAAGRHRVRGERRSRQQAAAAAGHEQEIERADLFDQLARGGALAGDDVRVIVGRDERQPALARRAAGRSPRDPRGRGRRGRLRRRSLPWRCASPPARPTASR